MDHKEQANRRDILAAGLAGAGMAATPAWAASERCCPVVELRRYQMRPGQREVLIEMFDHVFVAAQEAAGMRVIGQFRDLDDPDRFVWLRGFANMEARLKALETFYHGPIWRERRTAANATLIDSDNVLLLKPAGPNAGFDLAGLRRDPARASAGIVVATVCAVEPGRLEAFAERFDRDWAPALAADGAPVLARLVTNPAPNTFPALPVREGETSFVWLSRFASIEAHADHLDRARRGRTAGALRGWLTADPQTLRLAATANSLLRG